jgi:hypothetical protein
VLTAACGSSSVTELSGPTALRCVASAAVPTAPVPFGGAGLPVTISSARECDWSISSETSWLTASPASGTGEGRVTLTVAPNPQAAARTAAFLVNDQRFTLAQEASPCRFELTSGQARVGATGGTTEVGLKTLDGCAWSAAATDSWLRVPRASGSGSASIEVIVDGNSGDERRARVLVGGETFTIVQDRHVVPDPATPASPEPAPVPTPTPAVPGPLPPVPPLPPLPPLPPVPPLVPLPPLPTPQPGGEDDNNDDDDDDKKDKGDKDKGGGKR